MLALTSATARLGRAVIVATLMAGLAGCSYFEDEEPVAVESGPPEIEKVLMTRVTGIDFGRTFDGAMISVQGVAPGLGYQLAELRNHSGGLRGPDGFAQFDLVAAPPTEELADSLPAPAGERALKIRADRQLNSAQLRNVRGVRVFTSTGAVQRQF